MARIAAPRAPSAARRAVADAGDVRLVAHQPVEHELGPRGDLARRARRPAAGERSGERRAPIRTARRAATSPRRRRGRRAPGRRGAPAARRGRGAPRRRPSPSPARARPPDASARSARAVGGRVGDDDVVGGRAPASHSASGSVKARIPRRTRARARARAAPGSARTSRRAAPACRPRGAAGRRRWRRTRRGRRRRRAGPGLRSRRRGARGRLPRAPSRRWTLSPEAALECRAPKRDITPSPIRSTGSMGTGEPSSWPEGERGPGANRRVMRRSASLSARARQLTP